MHTINISAATAVEVSHNAKTGPISVTMTSQASCPSTCPFIGKGCYAESGRAGIHTRRLNSSPLTDAVEIAEVEATAIRRLSGRSVLRLHIVGDAKTDESAQILAEAAAEHTAKFGKPVYTYTHAHNVHRSSWGSVSVMRSCENHGQVVQALADGYGAAVVVPEFESDKPYVVGDTKYVPCPQQTGAKPNCVNCRLCFNADKLCAKRAVIVFQAHGSRSKLVQTIVKGAAS